MADHVTPLAGLLHVFLYLAINFSFLCYHLLIKSNNVNECRHGSLAMNGPRTLCRKAAVPSWRSFPLGRSACAN